MNVLVIQIQNQFVTRWSVQANDQNRRRDT